MDYRDKLPSHETGSRFNRRNRANWVRIHPALTTLAILEAYKAPTGEQRNLGAILQAIGRPLRQPIVLGPLLGIVFSRLGIPLPEAASRSFQLIGQAAGGVALFLTD
jgi:malonate transporter